jgi:hypothetical protein
VRALHPYARTGQTGHCLWDSGKVVSDESVHVPAWRPAPSSSGAAASGSNLGPKRSDDEGCRVALFLQQIYFAISFFNLAFSHKFSG